MCLYIHSFQLSGHQTWPFHPLFICFSNLQIGACPEQLNQVLAQEKGELIWHVCAYKQVSSFNLLSLHLTYKL